MLSKILSIERLENPDRPKQQGAKGAERLVRRVEAIVATAIPPQKRDRRGSAVPHVKRFSRLAIVPEGNHDRMNPCQTPNGNGVSNKGRKN